jgi:hypothetical protein
LPSNSGAGQEKPHLVWPGYHTHDGFYMRLLFGVGYVGTFMSNSERTESYRGPGITPGLALGWSITPRLIVYAEGFLSTASPLTAKLNGAKVDTTNSNLVVWEAGPGACYFIRLSDDAFWPSLYVSGSLLLQAVEMGEPEGTKILSDVGYGFDVTFGGEWWAWDNWAAGAGLRFSLASSKVRDADARWTTLAGAFVLTLTYN